MHDLTNPIRMKPATGTKIGGFAGAICPVLAHVGMAVGGFIGGVVGKIADSKVGQTIGKSVKTVAHVAKKM